MKDTITATYHRAIVGLSARDAGRRALVVGLVALALGAAGVGIGQAAAESYLVITGAGEGHGVGLSQWGAYGFARHGYDHRSILTHYFSDTSLGQAPGGRQVRVLLAGNRSSLYFSGATRAGSRSLDPKRIFSVVGAGPTALSLRGAGNRALARLPVPLRVSGSSPLTLEGLASNGIRNGAYRGSFELRPARHGGLNAVNVLALEDYVRGVVSQESPSYWPAAALEAQAVVSRTYAITTSAGGLGFDQYSDTRSQQYGGVVAERPSTDRATSSTRGQVVTYAGRPAATYFFSSSGGQTEDVQNSFPGTSPAPWLRSVDDPYDTGAPLHRWGPYRMTLAQATARLGGLVQGTLQRIDVTRRGVSPRIVSADVVGSGGRTSVTGQQLRAALGLNDTWACFAVATGSASSASAAPGSAGSADSGGAAARAIAGGAVADSGASPSGGPCA